MRREKMKNRSLRSWVIIVLPCTSRKALRTHDSQKGIEEILNSKLATILEEPENVYDIHGSNNIIIEGQDDQSKKLLWFKGKNGKDLFRARLFKRSRLHLLDSHNLCCFKGSYYINFLAGFGAKGSLIGLSR